MKENQNNHYFNEAWDAAMKDFFWSKTKRTLEAYYLCSDFIRVDSPYDPMRSVREPIPEFLKEWLEQNPYPKVFRDEFIIALTKRVEALEAALAGKGGAQ